MLGSRGHRQRTRQRQRRGGRLQQYPHLPDAVERLAGQLASSPRQAYRYLRQAQQLTALVPVSGGNDVLSVRLPRGLIRRLRERSLATRTAVSELVARALQALLASREPHG